MKHIKNILIILPRGESIRNFIYSGIIKELKKSYEITLVSVKPNDDVWNIIKNNADELHELKDQNFSYRYRIIYEILDLAHNKYMWSEASKVRWNMRDFEAKSLKSKLIRVTKKTIARLLSKDISLRFIDKILDKVAFREKSVLYWIDILKNKNYDLVFNTSHSHSINALQVVYAAKFLNYKTAAFLFSWDNLTSQGRVIPEYNYYFSWNSSIKNDFHRIYPKIKNERVLITGTPQFINHFDDNFYYSKTEMWKLLGLDDSQSYIVYSSGMSHHMPFEPFVVERIADIIYKIDSNLKLVVRAYAKDRADVFDQLKNIRPDIIIPNVLWEKNYQTPLIEDQKFLTSLLKYCILGINVASTISLELILMNKPAINVGYNPPEKNIYPYDYTRFYNFDHYKPIVESGAILLAKNEDEMGKMIKDSIQNPNLNSLQRQKLVKQFFEDKLDSVVIQNFIQALLNITNHVES